MKKTLNLKTMKVLSLMSLVSAFLASPAFAEHGKVENLLGNKESPAHKTGSHYDATAMAAILNITGGSVQVKYDLHCAEGTSDEESLAPNQVIRMGWHAVNSGECEHQPKRILVSVHGHINGTIEMNADPIGPDGSQAFGEPHYKFSGRIIVPEFGPGKIAVVLQ